MDLWIRSQDKKFIVKVNNGIFINKYCGQGHINGYEITCGCGGSLGIYSEERTLEVLDEIHEILKGTKMLECLNKNNGNMDNVYPILTYQMPKE